MLSTLGGPRLWATVGVLAALSLVVLTWWHRCRRRTSLDIDNEAEDKEAAGFDLRGEGTLGWRPRWARVAGADEPEPEHEGRQVCSRVPTLAQELASETHGGEAKMEDVISLYNSATDAAEREDDEPIVVL